MRSFFLLAPDAAPAVLVAAWLLTYAFHSTLLLGGAWLLSQRPRFQSEGTQDTLWKAALLGGLLTATLQLFGGTGQLFDETPVAESIAVVSPDVQAEIAFPTTPVAALPVTSAPARLTPSAPFRPADAAPWLVATWLLGAGLLGARLLSGRLRFAQRLGKRRPVSNEGVLALLDETVHKAAVPRRLRNRLRLTTAANLSSPVALGRSEICLPERALTEMEPALLRPVLAHELAHLVRRDPLWLALTASLERLFFFQPLNRIGRRQQQAAAEFLCDAWAVRHTGAGPALARSLVQVATWIKGAPPVPAVCMARPDSPLVRRVQNLLEGEAARELSQPARLLLVGGLLVLITVAAPGLSLKKALPEATAAAAAMFEEAERALLEEDHDAKYEWHEDDHHFTVILEGEVHFAPDYERIAAISPGGAFRAAEEWPRHRRVLIVRPGSGNDFRYEYRVDGSERPFNEGGQAFLVEMLQKMRRMEADVAAAQEDMERAARDLARAEEEIERAHREMAEHDFEAIGEEVEGEMARLHEEMERVREEMERVHEETGEEVRREMEEAHRELERAMQELQDEDLRADEMNVARREMEHAQQDMARLQEELQQGLQGDMQKLQREMERVHREMSRLHENLNGRIHEEMERAHRDLQRALENGRGNRSERRDRQGAAFESQEDDGAYYSWSDGDRRVEVRHQGDVVLAGGDVRRLSSDGYLIIEETAGATTRRVEMRPADDGRPLYTYFVDDRRQPFGAEAEAWLARVLPDVRDRTPLGD